MSSEFSEDKGEAYYDHSRYGHSTYGGGDSHLDEILIIIFPETKGCPPTRTQFRDAMHVETHRKYGRDYFVTKDGGILYKKNELKEKFGITVLSPKECLEELKSKGITN